MEARRINPSEMRARVIQLLAKLPPDDHLEALHAIDAGDVQLDLTDPLTVRVVLAERWSFELPAIEWPAS